MWADKRKKKKNVLNGKIVAFSLSAQYLSQEFRVFFHYIADGKSKLISCENLMEFHEHPK